MQLQSELLLNREYLVVLATRWDMAQAAAVGKLEVFDASSDSIQPTWKEQSSIHRGK